MGIFKLPRITTTDRSTLTLGLGELVYDTDLDQLFQGDGATAGGTAVASGTGDVVGPASSVNNRVVFFDGTTGKLIKDSGLTLSGSNTGDQTITLTGDVTGSGTGSFATTIANSAVTLAKMANVATASVFYRKTSGTGAPEVQTLATLKTDLGLTGTNSGDQTITLTGDVTGSGTGSFAATISNNSVTLAKMDTMATASFLGRNTAGTGNVEVLSVATVSSMLSLSGTNSGDETTSSIKTKLGAATTSTDGYLTSTDWNTFNSKEPALTKGNLTESTSSVLTITGGSNAIIGSGLTIQVKQATSLVSGYLSSTDWSTFNGKQDALSGSGIVKSTGGAISYLTDNSANWDTAYTNRITTLTTTGSSGAATLVSNTLNIPNYTLSGLGGQPLATNLTSLAALSYVSASFVKMTASGTFSLDTATYLTGNQTITLSGDVSGSGTTAITTTIGANKVTVGMMAQAAANSILGNNTGSAANVAYLTGTQVTAMLDTFSTSTTTKGLVTGSNGAGTGRYLNSNGTWQQFSTGLGNSSGTITVNLSTGLAGGQSAIGGTAASENLTLSSTSNATKGKILFGTSAYDEVNNRLGLGTASPSCMLNITAGTISDGGNASLLTATMPSTATAQTTALQLTIAGAGSSAFQQNAMAISFTSGFTGNSACVALNLSNANAGIGTGFVTGAGNFGLNAVVSGTTTGRNLGGSYVASGGDINQGVLGRATTAKNSATNIGVVGAGVNTGTSPIFLGGYFTCGTGTPTLTSAALMCDNDTQAVDIFVARDNGTKVWSIADGGNTTWADAINMSFGTTTGTKIGTATGQKIGFWNATPIVQPTTGVTAATFAAVAGGSAVDTNDTFDGYTIGQVVKALRNLGILA